MAEGHGKPDVYKLLNKNKKWSLFGSGMLIAATAYQFHWKPWRRNQRAAARRAAVSIPEAN